MKPLALLTCGWVAILLFGWNARAESPAPSPDTPQGDVVEQVFHTDARVSRALHEIRGERDEDPIRFLAGDMTGIMGDLSRYMTDKPVQVKQEKVVGELDYLIAVLEKQCKSSGSGSNLNPTKPRADSILANGPGGINDLHDPKAGEKQWGQLPPKLREQILQSKTDGFPPGYEALLQSYYRRLAQEQVGSGSEEKPAVAPTSQPASR